MPNDWHQGLLLDSTIGDSPAGTTSGARKSRQRITGDRGDIKVVRPMSAAAPTAALPWTCRMKTPFAAL